MNLQTDVPLINVPLSTPDGRANPIWFQFFVQLWRRTGSGSGGDGQLTVSDVLSFEVTDAPVIQDTSTASLGWEATFPHINQPANPLANEVTYPSTSSVDPTSMEMTMYSLPEVSALTEMLISQLSDSMATQAAKSVTLGASPATYTATYRQTFHITGGTISAISLIRSGTSLPLATTTNLIELSPGDQVTVTYTVLPTTTILGR